ncbi:MAG: N-6 DNA methylase [Phycisphaerales bacterium]
MAVTQLIKSLGYRESRRFLSPDKDNELPASELSFALRHTAQACKKLSEKGMGSRFHGTYVLQEQAGSPAVPVVHVFETESDTSAKDVHRMIWNQNLVPFIIIVSPSMVRVYPGFSFSRTEDKSLVSVAAATSDVLSKLDAFSAHAIDEGMIWQRWGQAADPTSRVDETLLRDLKSLDGHLQKEGVSRRASHGLIGKFVYLYYLRDRDFLSDRKLIENWGVAPSDVFSRYATLKAFRAVNEELQRELNGSVFQMGDDALATITQPQLRLVASVFCGDAPTGQLHLDFEAYDFSHIPIETLSCVYEQFLHDTDESEGQSRGQTLGAYYTPIPLADYVISELEQKYPLEEGMRVLDPACGSGTFLVQCYRRLIEKKMRTQKRSLKATELRELLVRHVFGVDRDDDACRVAELSLILTLLDYVDPPDLENTNFKLPTLRQSNIFQDDFFDPDAAWNVRFQKESFHWIVGNPPWAEVKGKPAANHEHYLAWKWITTHKTTHPTGGNQIAEAFLWKAGDHLTPTGVSGLVVPAMTWFKKESVTFRKTFFSQREVWCLANFANMAYVLFAGRAESPTSAVFFKPKSPADDHAILTFAPFVAEQVANRPSKVNARAVTWNIAVNGSEMRDIANQCAVSGKSLTWKLAMWGSARDERFLRRMEARFTSFDKFCADSRLLAHQGFELRTPGANGPDDLKGLIDRKDLIGKQKVLFQKLRGVSRIFHLPERALGTISAGEAYIRKRGGLAGLAVSESPHILVDATRRFAVFSDEFIAVPPRQIGISGPSGSEGLLRALSLYLSSDFCIYHQFFASPQWGIDKNLADLDTLKQLPVPLEQLDKSEIQDWNVIQRELVALSKKGFAPIGWDTECERRFSSLLSEVNSRVFGALGIRPFEQLLVEDFVHANLELNKGKVTREATRAPTADEQELYLETLRDCLDEFLSSRRGVRHKIEAIRDRESAFFSISLQRASAPVKPAISPVDHNGARNLLALRERLRHGRSQWLYFDRGLKIYDRKTGVLYQFKPMQRLHWTRRQAILDSDEIIAETVSAGGTS